MRRTRLLLLAGIVVILAGVAGTYYLRRTLQERLTPPAPQVLPLNVNAEGKDWVYTHHEEDRPVVEVRASKMRQVAEPATFELEGVQLRIFDPDGQTYDHVRSAFATFDTASGELFSEGKVDITLGTSSDGKPAKDPVVIQSSGVHFEAATGKATTDRPTNFRFGRAEGQATGASYDPRSHDLRMHSQVTLRLHPEDANGKTMVVEAGELVYKEDDSKVYLSPWSRFKRGSLAMEAASSVVTLENGQLKLVDADSAKGTDHYPSRHLEYAASNLMIDFTPTGEVSRVTGEENATIKSTSDHAQTSVSSDRIYLMFEGSSGDSILKEAFAMGKSVLESKPVPRDGVPLSETRLMRSDVIKTLMRPGGQEIEVIETQSPGTIEFLPNRSDQKRRRLEGDRIWLHYGTQNRLQVLRARDVSTRTEPLPSGEKEKKASAPMLTRSQQLLAEFDPATGDMARMEQSGDFRYEEGARKANAASAELISSRDLITLRDKARVWDDTGATAADAIFLDQKAGNVFATGNVSSTRLPDKRQKQGSVLDATEPLHATAEKMATSENNSKILYEGNAVLWQGSNRLQAQRIEIDRGKRAVFAQGQVVNQTVEKAKKPGSNGKPAFLVVKSDELYYDDSERRAHYSGNVRFHRAAMEVTAQNLQAFFSKPAEGSSGDDSETSLDRAIADGEVRIVQQERGRTRTGTGEHGEYYVGEEKVVLRGGNPKLTDTVRGTTEGRELTYFAANDKLLVGGAEDQRAVSVLNRK